MTTPSQSLVEKYRDAAIALLPPGHAFPKSIVGDFAKLLEALAVDYASVDEVAQRLLLNYNPATAEELLPEWEEAVGLAASGTTAERQGAVVTKLRGRTSHSRGVFEDAALALGFGTPAWMRVSAWTDPALQAVMAAGARFVAPQQFLSGVYRFSFSVSTSHAALAARGYIIAHVSTAACIALCPADGFVPGSAYLLFQDAVAAAQLRIPVTFNPGDNFTVTVNTAERTVHVLAPSTAPNGATYSSPGDHRLPLGEYRVADRETLFGSADNLVLAGQVTAVEAYDRSGIRFAQYQPALAGRARAGESITNDSWANVVVAYVPAVGVSSEAKLALRAAWDYLTRSHGYVHIIYTGAGGSTIVQRSGSSAGSALARLTLSGVSGGTTYAPFVPRAFGTSSAAVTIVGDTGELPLPPDGYAYVLDSAGNYMVDSAGNYMVAPTGEAPTGSSRPSTSLGVGFYVVGRKIYDANGNEFRMRGTNKTHQDNWAPGLAYAGSNTTRWNLYFSDDPTRCINDMTSLTHGGSSRNGDAVQIGGFWDGTCNDSSTPFNAMVNRWVRDAALYQTTVVEGYPFERFFILNIANEWGGDGLAWRNAYVAAIPQIRAAGFHGLIMVDAPGCGQNPQPIIQYGADILNADPEKNVCFSLHVYGNFYDTGSGITQAWSEQNDLAPSLAALAATGLAVIVGEFGPGRNIGPSPTMITPQRIIALCEQYGIGWLSWSWDDNNLAGGMSDDDSFSHSYNGNYNSSADLTIFGKVIVEDPAYGWKALAQPASIFGSSADEETALIATNPSHQYRADSISLGGGDTAIIANRRGADALLVGGGTVAPPANDPLFGGAPTLVTNGTQWFDSNQPPSFWRFLHNGTGCTVITVFAPVGVAAGSGLIISTRSSNQTGFTQYRTGAAVGLFINENANTIVNQAHGTLVGGAPTFIAHTFSGSAYQCFLKSTLLNAGAPTGIVSAGDSQATLRLGARPDGTSGIAMRWAETLIYPRVLTSGDWAVVYAYIQARYGIV